MKNYLIKKLGGVTQEEHDTHVKQLNSYHDAELRKRGTVVDESNIFMTFSNGKEHCDEDNALAVLLADGVLFCNERHLVWDGQATTESTTVLYVGCNDLFYWGTGDAECLPNSEIGKLYKMHKENPKWGSTKWCCLRRNLRPQAPVVKAMKKAGYWDAEMETLPAPELS